MSYYRSSALQTSRQDRRWRRNQNTITFESTAKLGVVSHTVLVALMVAVLGLIYLTQITKTSTYGYELSDINSEKTKLLSQKSDLEVENARLQALERIQSSEVASNMSKPASVDTIRN